MLSVHFHVEIEPAPEEDVKTQMVEVYPGLATKRHRLFSYIFIQAGTVIPNSALRWACFKENSYI